MNDNDEVSIDVSAGIQYIREHPEVTNVLLTGGDPLLMSTRRLVSIFEELHQIPHVKIIRIGTSASIQNDIRLGSHVMSEYGIGMDPMVHFYQMDMGALELEVSQGLQKEIGLPYLPYCVRGSDELIELFRDKTILGNTVTCHGFYAPQGRSLRLPIRYPDLVDKLNYFHVGNFWLTNLEMETAGYYALAKLLGHEMISMNAIIANRIRNKFSKDPNKVVDSLIRKVLETI